MSKVCTGSAFTHVVKESRDVKFLSDRAGGPLPPDILGRFRQGRLLTGRGGRLLCPPVFWRLLPLSTVGDGEGNFNSADFCCGVKSIIEGPTACSCSSPWQKLLPLENKEAAAGICNEISVVFLSLPSEAVSLLDFFESGLVDWATLAVCVLRS